MSKRSIDFPPRLVEGRDAAGVLLRQALEESISFPSESACYHGLVEKRAPIHRAWGRWFAVLTTASVAVILVFFLLVRRGDGSWTIAASADHQLAPVVGFPTPRNVVDGQPVQAHDTTPAAVRERRVPRRGESRSPDLDVAAAEKPKKEVAPPLSTEPHPKVATAAFADLAADGAAETSSAARAAQASSAPPAEAQRRSDDDTANCAKQARSGRFEEAASCYAMIAKGSGMASELALYEKARLESRALGRGAVALATLEEYARRFPRGALATEAGLTRIELLARLGRSSEALEAIDRALGQTMGQERGGDLHLIRGDLLSHRGDCRGALVEYAAARAAGIHPTRLHAGERRCAASANSNSRQQSEDSRAIPEKPNE